MKARTGLSSTRRRLTISMSVGAVYHHARISPRSHITTLAYHHVIRSRIPIRRKHDNSIRVVKNTTTYNNNNMYGRPQYVRASQHTAKHNTSPNTTCPRIGATTQVHRGAPLRHRLRSILSKPYVIPTGQNNTTFRSRRTRTPHRHRNPPMPVGLGSSLRIVPLVVSCGCPQLC